MVKNTNDFSRKEHLLNQQQFYFFLNSVFHRTLRFPQPLTKMHANLFSSVEKEPKKYTAKKIQTWGPSQTKDKEKRRKGERKRLFSNENNIQKHTRSSSFPNLYKTTITRPDTSDPNISKELCKSACSI